MNVNENSVVNSIIGRVPAEDPDSGDELSYTVFNAVLNNDGTRSRSTIIGVDSSSNLIVLTPNFFNFEERQTIDIFLNVNDNSILPPRPYNANTTVTIKIQDVSEPPRWTSPAAFGAECDAQVGDKITNLSPFVEDDRCMYVASGCDATPGSEELTFTKINEWTLVITSQVVAAAAVGATVTQGSATGTLKTAISGATTSIIVRAPSTVSFVTSTNVVIGGVVSDITILAANIQSLDEWVFDITSQTITENVGVAVTQNEWTLTITSQVIAATAAGVTITQGTGATQVTGTLKTALLGGETTSIVITVAAGVTFNTNNVVINTATPITVTLIATATNSISATGKLTTALNGASTSIVVSTDNADVVYSPDADLTVGSTTITRTTINTAMNGISSNGISNPAFAVSSTGIVSTLITPSSFNPNCAPLSPPVPPSYLWVSVANKATPIQTIYKRVSVQPQSGLSKPFFNRTLGIPTVELPEDATPLIMASETPLLPVKKIKWTLTIASISVPESPGSVVKQGSVPIEINIPLKAA